jgi:hypothetical protein
MRACFESADRPQHDQHELPFACSRQPVVQRHRHAKVDGNQDRRCRSQLLACVHGAAAKDGIGAVDGCAHGDRLDDGHLVRADQTAVDIDVISASARLMNRADDIACATGAASQEVTL